MNSKELVTTFAGVTELIRNGQIDDREGSRVLMSFVESRLASRDFATVNDLVGEILTGDFSPRLTISVLRCTFRVRSELPNWQSALDKISKGVSPEHIIGLNGTENKISAPALRKNNAIY